MKNIRICIFIYFSNNTNHYFKQFQMCFLYKNTIKPKNNTYIWLSFYLQIC